MSVESKVAFAKAIGEVNTKISEFQRLDDDILRADLMPVIQAMDNIKCADSVSNANKYAESLTDLSHLGLEKSKKLQRGYLKPSFQSVWEALRSMYEKDNGFDWNQLGEDVTPLFSNVGTINFMSGALFESKKKEKEKEKSATKEATAPKRAPVRRIKEAVQKAVAPTEVQKEETNEFTKTTQVLHKRIKKDLQEKKKEEVEMLPEMIDKASFSKTVENFFAASFLIANGRLGVNVDNDHKTMIRLTRPTEDTDEQSGVNQGILSLNPMQTFELLKANGLIDSLDEGWNTKCLVCSISFV
ncbi:hypothetical protein WA556_003443 [Blastocystis sp. ATCC 50177/Nand II]